MALRLKYILKQGTVDCLLIKITRICVCLLFNNYNVTDVPEIRTHCECCDQLCRAPLVQTLMSRLVS